MNGDIRLPADWGEVPDDGDLRAFSKVPPNRGQANRRNKRHHYISVTYMDGFAGDDGRVWAYRAEAANDPHRALPASVGYENHYYSHKRDDGTLENHGYEDLWGQIETPWTATRRALAAQRLGAAMSFNLLGMVAMMRVRVPAAREATHLLLAQKLRSEALALEEHGLLPEELKRYAGELDAIPIGINPVQTLLAMREGLLQQGDLCFRLGFEVLHNSTNLPFITSDNPVCIYDPRVPFQTRRPYEYDDHVELIFPVDARTALRGSSRLRPTNVVVGHRKLRDERAVCAMNETIAQFGYRLVIAPDRSSDAVIAKLAATSPTIETDVRVLGKTTEIHWRNRFGPRPTLSRFIDTPQKAARLEAQLAAPHGNDPLDRAVSQS